MVDRVVSQRILIKVNQTEFEQFIKPESSP